MKTASGTTKKTAKATVAKKEAAAPAKKTVAKKEVAAPVKKAVAKKETTAPAKKTVAKKEVAKKEVAAPAKKTVAKKEAAAPAKKIVAKKEAVAPAKKTVAKKEAAAPAKKTVAKKEAAARVKKVAAKKEAAAPAKKTVVKADEVVPAVKSRIKKLKLNKGEKKHYIELLKNLRQDFLRQLRFHQDDALSSKKDAAGERAGMATHMADLGSDNFRHDVELGLLSDEADVILMIDEALQRIEDSEYGICIECGCLIAPARLEAKPYARFCTKCKSRLEALEDPTRRHR